MKAKRVCVDVLREDAYINIVVTLVVILVIIIVVTTVANEIGNLGVIIRDINSERHPLS